MYVVSQLLTISQRTKVVSVIFRIQITVLGT